MRNRHTTAIKLAVAAIAAAFVASPVAFAGTGTSWITGHTHASRQSRATSHENRSLSGSNAGHGNLMLKAGPEHSRAEGWVSGKTLHEAENGNFQAVHQHGDTGGSHTNSAYHPNSSLGA